LGRGEGADAASELIFDLPRDEYGNFGVSQMFGVGRYLFFGELGDEDIEAILTVFFGCTDLVLHAE
jgi:hypothetical protein